MSEWNVTQQQSPAPNPVGLVNAVHALQAEVSAMPKTAENPFFNSSYVPLDKVVEIIQPLLTKHGLVWMTFPTHIQGDPALRYELLHKGSGEVMDGTVPLCPGKRDPQGIGASITYMRRYALCAVLNLVADEDDDGNKASARAPKKTKIPEAVFSNQIRETGVNGSAIGMRLKTEPHNREDVPERITAAYLDSLPVKEQALLLKWAKEEA